MNVETKLLIMLCSYDFDRNEVIELMEKSRWEYFLGLCCKHKVGGIIYYTSLKNELLNHIPHRVYYYLKYFYIGNERRNEIMFRELNRLMDYFHSYNVEVLPLKGAILASDIYESYGERSLNDLDFFIRKKEQKNIASVMKSLGYVQGGFDRAKRQIIPMTREEDILWKMKMFNMYPFTMKFDDDYIDDITIDFTFGLIFEQHNDISELLFKNKVNIGCYETLSKSYFFIHLCCHLYKEYSRDEWRSLGLSVNLIKVIDIYRFYHKHFKRCSINDINEKAEELGVKNAVDFSLKMVSIIFSDFKDIVKYINIIPGEVLEENHLVSQISTL
ncbi:nucleotidyltransferase family protein [Photobacterium damselae]|uniref:nucleotidyltransferase family protein n=1 Tax=Photobacterium damselae TaxID=38293 RepID=UPI001EFED4C4|nr:nucleotidyltransferase family protein [Photobacterium damselae]MCG9780666.1 nucleotidyltransferase family protein [Photobacterium damselae]